MTVERPWCCPEHRCVPVHQLANRRDLATPKPGDTFMCFGRMSEPVEFTYDGEHHKNDLNSCWATALKGVIRNQENASDWRMLAGAYKEAYDAVCRGEGRTACGGSLEKSSMSDPRGGQMRASIYSQQSEIPSHVRAAWERFNGHNQSDTPPADWVSGYLAAARGHEAAKRRLIGDVAELGPFDSSLVTIDSVLTLIEADALIE